MGILDLPAPVLSWIDGELGLVLGPAFRLVIWAAMAALISMTIYRELTPQRRLAVIEVATLRIKRRLDRHEGELAEAMPIILRMLRLSLLRLRLVLLPALVGALPVICLFLWASSTFNAELPRDPVAVVAKARPDSFTAVVTPPRAHAVVAGPATSAVTTTTPARPPVAGKGARQPHVVARDPNGQVVVRVALKAPVETIEKRAWWNALIGNPGGYLPANGPIDRIDLNLPRMVYLPFGPDWLRGWEALFFGVMLLSSIGLKLALRIR
jgi:hypothetical protein